MVPASRAASFVDLAWEKKVATPSTAELLVFGGGEGGMNLRIELRNFATPYAFP
jgi:hypothetical protein